MIKETEMEREVNKIYVKMNRLQERFDDKMNELQEQIYNLTRPSIIRDRTILNKKTK